MHRLRSGSLLLLLLVLQPCSLSGVFGQVSKPLASKKDVDDQTNKFLQRKPELDDKDAKSEDEEVSTVNQCKQNVHLRWMTEVSSSVYSTPVITDLFSDGQKEIIVPSFVHYLEALEGETGSKVDGWPVFHKSNSHGSVFLHDVDKDGIVDIGMATYEGEITWFKDTGEKLPQTSYVPKLRIKKDWFVGLGADPNDHSHPDVGSGDPFETQKNLETAKEDKEDTQSGASRRRSLLQVQQNVEEEHKLSDEAEKSFSVFKDDYSFEDIDVGQMEKETDKRNTDFSDKGIYHYDFEDYDFYHQYAEDDFWDSERFDRPRSQMYDGDYLYVDAHVLGTPVIADIDGDMVEELIVPVTYYYDRDYYEDPEHSSELPKDVDTTKYLATGIVCYDIYNKYVKWSTHLDLTTEHIEYRAYLFSKPTVVDIDHDGYMEIVVGTAVGFLYVLDYKGNTRPGWPIQMGSIEGQVLVEDLNGDGKLEIVAADRRGSIAMFDIHGKEIWERHLKSSIAQAPTAGDVDGDGKLEIAVGTYSGHIYVLEGRTGDDKAPFPFRVRGEIMSPILITRLADSPGQQLVLTAADGFLYVVDGETACVDAQDLGEECYAMVLADDLNDDGHMDLVVSSLNGNIYVFDTKGVYHPLRTWTAENHGISSLLARDGMVGIFASTDSRVKRDVRGDRVMVTFDLVDNRPPMRQRTLEEEDKNNPGQKRVTTTRGPYNVTVLLKNVGVREMNAGDAPVIGVMETYDKPGTYTVTIPCPKSRSSATVRLEMKDRNKIIFVDEFSLSFHMHWYKLIKWLIAAPFTAMAVVVLSVRSPFSWDRHLPS